MIRKLVLGLVLAVSCGGSVAVESEMDAECEIDQPTDSTEGYRLRLELGASDDGSDIKL